MKISGSKAILEAFLSEGVDLIFGYPGGAIMPLYDVLYDYEKEGSIRHILGRHEQGSIHSAQGYARVSGKTGVVIATSGPGATNLVTGLADAYIDSTPLVCITGQVGSNLLGSDAFQETDIVGISTPVTKWNYQITDAKDISQVLAKAFYIANSGRPGPVLIDITKDAQFGMINFKYEKCTKIRSYFPVPKPNEDMIQLASVLINNAKRPLVLFGQGVILSGAEKQLKEFVEKAQIPAAWTIMGLSALDSEHPLNVGMLGMHGNYAPNIMTDKCDLAIAIGMRFDDRVTGKLDEYLKNAKVIHIEIDPSEINKNVKVDVPIVGDAKSILKKLTKQIEENTHKEWLEIYKELYKREFDEVIKDDIYPTKGKIKMGEVIRLISEKSNSEAIIVTDVGQHQMIACRYSKFAKNRSIVTSGGLGTMGFGLPSAIGAKLGAEDREVVCIVGDGSFQMTIQELGVVMQYGIPVKVVILNNSFLGMVRQWQQLFFDKRYASTHMESPDFIAIADAYGISAKRVLDRNDLESSISDMINSKNSYILEVEVEKEGNVFPMVPTGFPVSQIRLK